MDDEDLDFELDEFAEGLASCVMFAILGATWLVSVLWMFV